MILEVFGSVLELVVGDEKMGISMSVACVPVKGTKLQSLQWRRKC